MICVRCNFEMPMGYYCPMCGWNQKLTPDKCKLSTIYKNWSARHYTKICFTTKEGYETAWKKISVFSHLHIQDITLDDWQSIFDNMAGYSLSAQKKLQVLISQLYKYAEVRGLVRFNISKGIFLDGIRSTETLPFEIHHIRKLRECAENKQNPHWMTARIVLMLIFTGYRPNELFSIRRSNINLKRNYIISGSKTAAGRNRIVPILPQIRKYLVELYLQSSYTEDDFLFKGSKGAVFNLRNWRQRCFYPMTYDLGFNSYEQLQNKKLYPHYTPYSGRHTFATLSHQLGMDKEAIIKIMGHTDFSTTSKYYIHTDIDYLKSEMMKLEELIGSF